MAADAPDAPDTMDDVPEPPPRRTRRHRVSLLKMPVTPAGDDWALTYMDTMTLLITLFVLFLSFASFDSRRFDAFTQAMSLAKHGTGVVLGTMGVSVALPPPAPPPPARPADSESGQQVLSALQGQIDRQGLAGAVKLHQRRGVVEMEINESVLFPLGSADLSEQGLSLVARLSEMLKAPAGRLSVEGHTDDLPIGTERFPSNWELSGARASAVARRLIDGGVVAERLRIVGYAATRPVALNADPDGRRKNRRVNIVLELPGTSEAGRQ